MIDFSKHFGFIIYAHDFKVVGLLNSALKYADTLRLLCLKILMYRQRMK